MIIVVDAEDRENEGDFICAAEKATPETINFILSGRGQFCTPLLPEIGPPAGARARSSRRIPPRWAPAF